MTQALCFNCGSYKFGAFSTCEDCGTGASSNEDTSIALTDHFLSWEQLDVYADIRKRIKVIEPDPEVGHWAFVYYLANPPENLLEAQIPQRFESLISVILKQLKDPVAGAEEIYARKLEIERKNHQSAE
ncbi:hypothetical protein N9P58_03515 [Puniceicoccaceae bacterium]|nr:hypothetical protein [Puniceicoccaceae bacterium]